MGRLKPVMDHPDVPAELKGPCKRMVWQINGSLAKARESRGASQPAL